MTKCDKCGKDRGRRKSVDGQKLCAKCQVDRLETLKRNTLEAQGVISRPVASTVFDEADSKRLQAHQKQFAEQVILPAVAKMVEAGALPAPMKPVTVEFASPKPLNIRDRLRGGSFADKLAERRAEVDLDSFEFRGGRRPTAEQRAILETLLGSGDVRLAEVSPGLLVLMVEAGAGTGKTATLEMIAQTMPGNGQYTAFNTSLVAESKPKFANTKVGCNTTHSLAFRAEGKRFAHRLGGARVRADQLADMLGIRSLTVMVGFNSKTLAAGFLAAHVMAATRHFCQSDDKEIGAKHFKYIDGIDMPESDGCRTYGNNRKVAEYLLPYAQEAWADLSDEKGQLPFAHDVYVKIWALNKPVIAADFILIDEAQDLSGCTISILRQQKGIVVLVGDSAQEIYTWRGCRNALAEFPQAPRLFLSQSFRFGIAIAQVANKVLETLEEPTQLRLKGLPTIPSKVEPIKDPACILCRTNAAAVAAVLGGIADGKRPFLVGGGADVVAFVEAAQALQQGRSTSHPELACFSTWAEVQTYSKDEEGEDLRLLVRIIDTFTCERILQALRGMPQEKDADFVVSTAHKSKGREWPTVRLASDFPVMSKCGDPERKLLYVAVTRAKLGLDVSECPFFTGEDALDITAAVAGQEAQEVVPPTPAVEPAGERPEEKFTWSKDRSGNWLVRGPAHRCKAKVKVYRRDGSFQSILLTEVVWEEGGVALYRKG